MPTIVTSRPSRIHTVPSPTSTIQCQRDHGSRSSRAGIRVSTILPSAIDSVAISASAQWGATLRSPGRGGGKRPDLEAFR